MLRLLLIVLVALSHAVHAQESLAVVETNYKSKIPEVFFLGDSVLIRLIYASNNGYMKGSEAAWYAHGKKLADADLSALSSKDLLGIQKFHDTIYYYGCTSKARSTTITIARVVGSFTPVIVDEKIIEGKFFGSKGRGKGVSVVTHDRKDKKFRAYNVHRGKIALAGDVVYNWNLDDIEAFQMAFIGDGAFVRSARPAQQVKVYLFDNTLAAVFDDIRLDPNDPRDFRRTMVVRKDFVTGKQDNDGFRIDEPRMERRMFRSSLNGNLLYRLLQTKDDWMFVVQDLDSNKVVAKFDVPKMEATYDKNKDYPFRSSKIEKLLPEYRKDPNAICVNISDFGDRKVINIGFENQVATKVHVVGLVTGFGPAAHLYYLTLDNFFIGSIDKGFVPISQDDTAPEALMYLFEQSSQFGYDVAERLAVNDYLVGVYSMEGQTRYTFIKFASKP